jgi:hypothetical protein
MKIPTPKLPYKLPPNAFVTKGGEVEVLELSLHLQMTSRIENIDVFNNLNTKFYARTLNAPPWLTSIKPTETYQVTIKNFSILGDFKGFLTVEKFIQSQWIEATNTYGAVLEGSLFYDAPESRLNPQNPFE